MLLDAGKGFDGDGPMTRLTPEVPFPEIEAWPSTYFANPYPLSEDHYLVTWSDKPLTNPGDPAGTAAMGIYLFDRFGNLNLIYRDPTISSMYPLPIRPRPKPPELAPPSNQPGPQEVVEDRATKVALSRILQGLKHRERRILEMRYGLGEFSHPHTLEEVGNLQAVSRERIRQIESKTLKRLADNPEAQILRDPVA